MRALNPRPPEKLGWAPSQCLRDGPERTYEWIEAQVATSRRQHAEP